MKNIKVYLYFLITLIASSCSSNDDLVSDKNQNVSNKMFRASNPITAPTVQIGNQIWMTKNLNVSRYRNGDIIPQVTNRDQWINLTTGAWCYYQNNTANGIVYGKLYNWYAVVDPRGLAPEGWHIPSRQEYLNLSNYLGVQTAGIQLKEAGSLHWSDISNISTNSSNFTALPGGTTDFGGYFTFMGYYACFWSTTPYITEPTKAYSIELRYDNDGVTNVITKKFVAMSVRCIKN